MMTGNNFTESQLILNNGFAMAKLDVSPESKLRFPIAAEVDGRVHVHFGQPISWLVMSPEQAERMARSLFRAADFIREVD